MSELREYDVYEEPEVMGANGSGLPPLEPPLDYEDDDDLDALEFDDGDELAYAAPAAGAEVEVARIQALEDYARRREAGRVNRKVAVGTTTSAVAGLVPALLVAVEGLNLPPDVEPFVLALAAALGAFLGGYFVRERPAPPGLGGA